MQQAEHWREVAYSLGSHGGVRDGPQRPRPIYMKPPVVRQPPEPEPEPSIESAADLESSCIPEMRWTIKGLLPQGMAILAGRPKQGKSWLALQLGLAVACGAPMLGFEVERGDALYLALEDGRARVQSRIRTLVPSAPHALGVATDWRPWNEGGDTDLDRWLSKHPSARLIIVDTWARIAPQIKSRGDTYSEAYRMLARLHGLARHHAATILIVTHTRKSMSPSEGTGCWLDDVMGTTATTGVADTILLLSRNGASPPATLHSTGRDIQAQDLPLAWTPTGWTAHRDPLAIAVEQLAHQAGCWEGTTTDLMGELGYAPGSTPSVIGRRLAIVKAELRELGVRVDTEHDRKRRTIRISLMTSGHPLARRKEEAPPG